MVSELLEIKRQMHETCVKRKAFLFLHKGHAWHFHFSQQWLPFDPGERQEGRKLKSCFLVSLLRHSSKTCHENIVTVWIKPEAASRRDGDLAQVAEGKSRISWSWAAGLVLWLQLEQPKKVLVLLSWNREGVCTLRPLLLSPHLKIWDLVQFWWKRSAWGARTARPRCQGKSLWLGAWSFKAASGPKLGVKVCKSHGKDCLLSFFYYYYFTLKQGKDFFVLLFFFWFKESKISALSGVEIWGETNNKTLGGGGFYLKNKQTNKTWSCSCRSQRTVYPWRVNTQTVYLRKD